MTTPVTLADQPTQQAGRVHADARATRGELLWICLIGVELALLYLPTVRWLYGRWTMSVWHHAHGLLIPFVVAYFAYVELRPLRSVRPTSSAWGFAFLVGGLVLHGLDVAMHTQLLSAASLILVLPGLSLLLLGPVKTRAIAFPLAFLVLMLPIPLAFTGPIHMALREIATAATSVILPLVGITAYIEGTSIQLTRASLLVGDACSGFSTLYAACAVAALTAYSCPVPWRRALVLAAAPPLAIAANIVRVVILVAVVNSTGVDVLKTWIHPASGMLTFALSLPIILWLGSPGSREGVA